jgi:hypothetical protein
MLGSNQQQKNDSNLSMKFTTPSHRFRRTFSSGWQRSKTLYSALLGAACMIWQSAQATPVYHGISAANVTVQQNDTGNTAASVTLIPTVSVNYLRVENGTGSGNSRADYFLQIGNSTTDNVTNGILISSITDNGRDNGEGTGTIYGTPAVDSNSSTKPGSSGQWWVPVFGDLDTAGTVTYPEYNFDFAAAYFPYAKGWYGGWLVNSGGTNNGVTANIANDHWIGNTNMILGVNVVPQGGGKVMVDLRQFGLDSRSNAVMLCVGGKNEENFADSQTNVDGTWTVTCRDDNGGAEADPSAFVCVPTTNHMVVAGCFMGDGQITMQSAPFNVTNTSAGVYHLTIPGVAPGHGVLIISGQEGGTYNGDNWVSYQATSDGWDIQTRDTGTDQTPNLQNLPASDAVASFIYIPAAIPGFTVTPTNGLVTSENGASATFTVQLDGPPVADVTVGLSSSQPALATASPSSLSFGYTNWNVPQIVTVTGVANTIGGGGLLPYTVDFSPAVSTDTNFNGLQPASVSLVNVEDDQPGITVWPTNGLVTTGAGGTATFYVFLNSAPADDVNIGIASSNPAQGAVLTSSLTFNAGNWSVPQAITVTGQDDGVLAGNIPYTIVATPAVSADPNYNGLAVASVSVTNLENEIAGLNISTGNYISVVEGGINTFTVALTAKPVSSVVVTYSSGNPDVGTLSPTTLTFTPGNWNVPQTITLTGVANSMNNGNVSYALNAAVTSSSPGYSTLVVPDITATTVETTVIALPSGECVYGLGMAPVGLDGAAVVTDVSASSFTSASVSIALTVNADPADTLGIRNDGTDTGLIGVSGNTISYGGSTIGTFTGGTGATPLTVALQSGTSVAAVQALVRAATFNASSPANYAQRTVTVTFNDGLGDVVSASKNIRVGLLRIAQFQDGADYGYGNYGGEADTELEQANPNTPYPAGGDPASGLFVDAPAPGTPNECQVLLRFDSLIGTNANQIPPGAIIVSADLNINVINTGNGGTLNRMLIPWDATNATWNSFSDVFGDPGLFADDLTARSEFDSQIGVSITDPNTGTVSGGATGSGDITIGVTPDIQAWANGEANYGWFVHGWNQETDGMGFSPSEDASVDNRPRLRVYWVPAGTASATFSYGVNGYTNTYDAEILQSTPDTTTSSGATIWSDGADLGQSDATEALIQFDNIIGPGTNQIPPNAHIEVAMLNLASVNSSAAMGDGGQFFALLEPWQDTNTTWNSWGPNGIQNDGEEAAATPTVTTGSPTLNPNVQGGFHSFEVTPDVQSWANGTKINYGWGIVPWPGGSDGWGIDTSEDTDVTNHPQLVVYYTAIGGSAPAQPMLLPLAVTLTQVQVKFSGTIGVTYSVWRAASLNSPWSSLGTAAVGNDGTATYTDLTPLSSSAFYRVSSP